MEGNPNLRSDPHSDFLVEMMHGARKFKILIAAVHSGILDDIAAIGGGDWVTDRAVSGYRGHDLDNTRRLLNCLAGIQLLDRGPSPDIEGEDRLYRNAICTQRYLLAGCENTLVPLFHAEETLMPIFLTNLPYVLKHGSVDQFPKLLWKGGYPQDDAFLTLPDFAVSARQQYHNNPSHRHSALQPQITAKGPGRTVVDWNKLPGVAVRVESLKGFKSELPAGASAVCNNQPVSMMQMGRELFMASWDCQQEQCLAALLDAFMLRGFKRLVDLGGGSGRLAWKICEAHPNVQVFVFDTPRIIESMEKPFCRSQNIKYIKGDFFCDPLPEADCFVLSHVLQEYDDTRVSLLLERVFEHLPPGGTVIIFEKFLREDKRAPVSALLDDLLSATICKGRQRTESEFSRLVARCGLKHLQSRRILGVNSFDAFIAKKEFEPHQNVPKPR